jgi:hypothetical protein
LLPKLLILKEQLFVRRRVHADFDLDSDKPCQPIDIVATLRPSGKKALNKHLAPGYLFDVPRIDQQQLE